MAENQVKLIISAIDNTKSAFDNINRQLDSMSSRAALTAGRFLVIKRALQEISRMATDAIAPFYDAVEQYYQFVHKIAAMMTSMSAAQGNIDISEYYQKAVKYAEELYDTLTDVDNRTAATLPDLMKMNEEMMKLGIFLKKDKEEIEAFANIANAIAVISQGSPAKEVQIRQELRALLQGEVNVHSQLASLLDKMVGGTLKEKLQLWRQSGTEIKEIGKLLKGYGEASKYLENTWSIIGSTLQTLKIQIMRLGFIEAYKAINNFLRSIIDFTRENAETISSGIYKGWLAVKGVLESIWNILKPFVPLFQTIGYLIGLMVEGLGLIAHVILPPITQRIQSIINAMLELVPIIINLSDAISALYRGNFNEAKIFASQIVDSFKFMWRSAKETFKGGLSDEMLKRYDEWEKKRATTKKSAGGKGGIDPFRPKDDKKKAEQLEKWREEYQEFLASLEADRQVGFQKELAQTEKWETDKLNKLNDFKRKGVISEKEYQDKRALIVQIAEEKILQIYEEYAQKEVDIENEITKELLNDYEKRIREIEDWEDEKVKKLEDLYNQDAISFETFQELKAKAHIAMLKKREEAEREYHFKIRQLQLGIELAEIKTAEKSRAITKEESLRRQIENQKELLYLLEQQAQKIAEAGDEEAWLMMQQQIQGVRDSIVDLNEKLRELTGTLSEGFLEAIYEYSEKVSSAFMRAKEAGSQMISSMESAFMEFFDVTSKGFLNFGNLARTILMSIYKEMLKILVIQPLVRAITGFFGGLFKHEGGLIMHEGGYIPRFHLGVDEVPAILQRGERVLSVEQNKIFEKLAKIINASQPTAVGAGGSVQIVNVIDPNLLNQYLSSSAGQKAVVNVISHQSSTIKKVLWG